MSERVERRFLYIAFGFPPLAGSGIQRKVRFTQLLPGQGWQPIVLTVSRWGNDIIDEEWERQIPKDIKVYRAPSFDPYRIVMALKRQGGNQVKNGSPKDSGGGSSNIARLIRRLFHSISIPDHAIWWVPLAVLWGLYIIIRRRPVLIYSSSGPFGASIAGLILRKLTGLPWVSEYRDPWAANPFRIFSGSRNKIESCLERMCLKNAEGLISTTSATTEQFRRRTPNSQAKRFITITNGFDIQDFKGMAPPPENEHLRIIFAGMFYEHRTPGAFFDGLKEAIKAKPKLGQDLQVVLVGMIPDEYRAQANAEPLKSIVEIRPYIPHSEVIKLLSTADVLYLPQAKNLTDFIPGKIFEYLASRRFIFAVVPPDGITADIIRRFEAGVIVSPEDVKGIADALLDIYDSYKNGALKVKHSLEDVMEFSWLALSEKLAGFFNEITEG